MEISIKEKGWKRVRAMLRKKGQREEIGEGLNKNEKEGEREGMGENGTKNKSKETELERVGRMNRRRKGRLIRKNKKKGTKRRNGRGEGDNVKKEWSRKKNGRGWEQGEKARRQNERIWEK